MISRSGEAFDRVAGRYDSQATDMLVSRWLRARVHARLDSAFPAGSHVLEIGCGTGEDAIHLAKRGVIVTATDASTAMLAQAQKKAQMAGVQSQIAFQQLDLLSADSVGNLGRFDGAFSNFGALNCTSKWSDVGALLSTLLRPGAVVGLGVMGRWCAWEIVYNLIRLRPHMATRRWRGHAVAHLDGSTFDVYYPAPGTLRRELGARLRQTQFRQTRLMGLGVWLPPSEQYAAVGNRPALFRILTTLERLSAAHRPFRWLGDHYWLELKLN